jgi:tetratricopeptide (TPR) repeat protein
MMSRATRYGAAFAGVLLLDTNKAEAGGNWLARLDEAQRLAATSGKDLFILFTGSEWCEACTEFERAVLSQPDFVPGAEPFIRVKWEFPASDTELSPDRRANFIGWRERYGIRAFPTVLLADATGRPNAVTGHIEVFRSRLLARLGRRTEAIAGFDAALTAKPLEPLDRATLLAEKAIVLSKAGQHNEASAIVELAEKVLEGVEPESSNESVIKYLRDRMRAARGDAVIKAKAAIPRDR